MGIGLLRAEHMFLQKERLPVVREMLLAATDAKNLEAESSQLRKELESATGEKRAQLEQRLNDVLGRMEGPMGHYRGAIERILPIIQDDFEQIFRVMQGKPTGPLTWYGQELDEEAFRQTMADEGRLIYRFDVQRTYGLR